MTRDRQQGASSGEDRAVVNGVGESEVERMFALGQRVTKRTGSSWTGKVVGFYSTALTPIGYAVESENEPGSVQIYPEAALTTPAPAVSTGTLADELEEAIEVHRGHCVNYVSLDPELATAILHRLRGEGE